MFARGLSRSVLLAVLVASMMLLAISSAHALPSIDEPTPVGVTVPYPGRLDDAEGRPVADGAYDFTFALYREESGGESSWSEMQEEVAVEEGTFAVLLGDTEPIPAALVAGGERWLEVAVRGPQESTFTALAPRQRLIATPATSQEASADMACPHDHFGEQWTGSGDDGLWIESSDQAALLGWSSSYVGLIGISTPYSFVWPSEREYGVYGYSYSDHGVYGRTFGEWSWTSGVYGGASKTNAIGVTGWNTGDGIGVYGYSEEGKAGHFNGPVEVVGYLTKTGGGFKIDHPLDPADKYLNHSFVESPDMKNVYDGVVVLGEGGSAWVDLPEWFEALNEDFRYQLTCIGGFAPVYVAQEVQNNRFQIAGGTPGLKVSWQVTGIRHDAYAEAHRIPVEEAKPPEEQGTYLYPEEHGMPETSGRDYQRNHALKPADAGGGP